MVGDSLQKAVTLEPISASLSFDNVTNLIMDVVTKHGRKPRAIVLSYRDRRALTQDTMDQSVAPVEREDANRDDMAIAFVQGVMVGWNRNVRDGHAVILMPETVQ